MEDLHQQRLLHTLPRELAFRPHLPLHTYLELR
ncbi:conserved hypothetical protein [Prevotella intermedia]|uniref:Uncharacterized protein n=1 Tax=Prevotella intermedia TaxID=28131 RepID=A0A0S3UJM4_PREIN|nr:conserved hypothetical protein [Prevotella intermedia]